MDDDSSVFRVDDGADAPFVVGLFVVVDNFSVGDLLKGSE